ncbi:hypothetical protein ONO23_05511 [Micromonospora noduli]|nr:hypothetical protein ONO23_05511 [Micromonospora noduli]
MRPMSRRLFRLRRPLEQVSIECGGDKPAPASGVHLRGDLAQDPLVAADHPLSSQRVDPVSGASTDVDVSSSGLDAGAGDGGGWVEQDAHRVCRAGSKPAQPVRH